MGTQSTWGVSFSQDKMKEVLPVLLVVLVLHQVSCDWTGTGELSCYGHLSTDVSTPEGEDTWSRGTWTVTSLSGMGPMAWDLRPCSSRLTLDQSGRCGPGITMSGVTGLYHLPPVRVISGIRRMTRVPGTVPVLQHTVPLPPPGLVYRRREGSLGVALPNALELSLVKDVENKIIKWTV